MFSWEYPGRSGAGNVVSASDSANFLLLLKQLRGTSAGKKLVLSVATATTPFAGGDWAPMTDVSEFAHYLDYVGASLSFPPARPHGVF